VTETERPSEEPAPEPPSTAPDESPFPAPDIERIEKGDDGPEHEG
jgi:hypothetical protein